MHKKNILYSSDLYAFIYIYISNYSLSVVGQRRNVTDCKAASFFSLSMSLQNPGVMILLTMRS